MGAPSVMSKFAGTVLTDVSLDRDVFVYADYHATTPVDPRVAHVVLHYMTECYGNASSADHLAGDRADEAVRRAREEVAALVDADPTDVIFTSGATESINIALQGFTRARAAGGHRPHVAVSSVEHRAVLETARALERAGEIRLSYVPVDGAARLDLDALSRLLGEGVDLVSVMAANNEVGTVNPVAVIGAMVAECGADFLCDGSQAVGKIALSVRTGRITFLACSAHKIYGPKGVGALVLAPGAPLLPVQYGGGQQGSLRPGTLNVPGIAAFGEAARLRRLEGDADALHVQCMRDTLEQTLLARLDGVTVHGAREARLGGNLHISVRGAPNGMVVARLRDRIGLATGAACTSGIEAPSHVLQAMGLDVEEQETALRIGLGKFTTMSDVSRIADELVTAVLAVRSALVD